MMEEDKKILQLLQHQLVIYDVISTFYRFHKKFLPLEVCGVVVQVPILLSIKRGNYHCERNFHANICCHREWLLQKVFMAGTYHFDITALVLKANVARIFSLTNLQLTF